MSEELKQKTTAREKVVPLLERRREQVRGLSHSPGISTTSNVEILLIEAELAAEDDYRGNPHFPSNDSVLEAAKAQIENESLVPAWEVVLDE